MNELRRRAAFWRNLEYDLDQMTYSIRAKSADQWVSENDTDRLEEVSHYLCSALAASRTRYAEVLIAQVDEWKREQVEKNV